MAELLEQCEGFQWDKGNSRKNWLRHQVTDAECEQVFFNKPLIVADDTKHLKIEKRWYVLGRTDSNRLLFVVFTIRRNLIRVISARDMNKKERSMYHEQAKKHS
jgi:uncharacterized DUF497 family protein